MFWKRRRAEQKKKLQAEKMCPYEVRVCFTVVHRGAVGISEKKNRRKIHTVTLTHADNRFRCWQSERQRGEIPSEYLMFNASASDAMFSRACAVCVYSILIFFYSVFFRLLAFLLFAFDGKGVLFGTQQNIKHAFCIRIRLHGIYNDATHTPHRRRRRHPSIHSPVHSFVCL